MIKEINDNLLISMKISPNSSKNEIINDEQGIKIKITAQPLDGKANKALIEFLSKEFKIPKSSFEIIKGQNAKEKTILLKNINDEKKLKVKEMLSFSI